MTPIRRRIRTAVIARYASPTAHRLIPTWLAVALVGSIEPRVRRLLRPAEATDALEMITDLVQFTPRADEARALTRRHLRERSILRELFWRPWLLKRSRVIDAHHWDQAHAEGRGCVVILGHIAGSWSVPGVLGRHGYDVHMVASAHMWEAQPEGLTGRIHAYLRHQYGDQALGPDRLIANTTPPEEVAGLVQAGKTVAIAFDVPGSAATPFLGRSVALASGPASLAYHAGVNVLPVISERHGTRMDLRMLEPLNPADFRDLPALRTGVARVYEAIVLRNPELVEQAWHPSPLVTEMAAAQAPMSPRNVI